jgi:hypothetical protein
MERTGGPVYSWSIISTTVEIRSEEPMLGARSVSGDLDVKGLDVGRDRCVHECCERVDVFWALDNLHVLLCELL